MANQYKNEVIYNGQTLISLKEDTVTPDKVLAGETFHDRSGTPQTGNLITHNVYDGLDSTSTSDALSANQGRELDEKYDALTSKITYQKVIGVPNGSSVTFEMPTAANFIIHVVRQNSAVPEFNGLYIGQAHNNGSILTIADSSVCDVSISGRVLTFTGSSNYVNAYIYSSKNMG